MGLELNEDMLDSIMSVSEADAWHGRIFQCMDRDPGPVESAIEELVTGLTTDPKATYRTNPLLWWIGILVQSSLQTDEDQAYALGAWSGRLNTRRTLIDGPKESWKPNLKVIKAVIHFATTTGRLVPKAWRNYNEDTTERERREIEENN